jgi:choline dehydrogenase-like flavoprotein
VPADELRTHGIAVRVDLPGVGRNLSEHARVPIEFATGGNTNAAVIMIAEKAADLILGRALAPEPARGAIART